MKIDVHNQARHLKEWKKSGSVIGGISKPNAKMIKEFLSDMEVGRNIGGSKGGRSPARLVNLKAKLKTLTTFLEWDYPTFQLKRITEDELLSLFNRMRSGVLTKKDGQPYRSVGVYGKIFKTFWHWYMKKMRKEGKTIEDITVDLDTSDAKPKWVYLKEEDVKKLSAQAKFYYRVMINFLYDSGVRSPSELMNLRVNNLEWDNKGSFFNLTVPEGISKSSFTRKIKLMLCSKLLKQHIKDNDLKGTDLLFTQDYKKTNQYLKRLAFRVLGIGKQVTQEKNRKKIVDNKIIDYVTTEKHIRSPISLYDFRHSSVCFWIRRYSNQNSLMFRFGWRKADKIFYYSEFLGLTDNIQKADLELLDEDERIGLKQQLEEQEKKNQLMKEDFNSMSKQMVEMQSAMAEFKRMQKLMKKK